MKLLAIDTSCDESCASIIDTDKWRLLADVVHTHVDLMQKYGGIVPEVASREHLRGVPLAVGEALGRAGLRCQDLDWIAVTNRPGLIGALLVGVSYAKALAFALGKPFSVHNHIDGHLFSPLLGTLDGKTAPPYPWIALVVSGGHTEIFKVTGPLEFQWLGGTLDDAAGEAFDKVGKILGLAYPAGPLIDKGVKGFTDAQRARFKFPRAKMEGLEFSFSGLKTAVALQVKKLGDLADEERWAVAAAAQEAIVDVLVDKIRLAQKLFDIPQVVVTGGVACNSRLRDRLPGAYFPSPRHCSDNSAMIALLAALQAKAGTLKTASWSTTAHAGVDFTAKI